MRKRTACQFIQDGGLSFLLLERRNKILVTESPDQFNELGRKSAHDFLSDAVWYFLIISFCYTTCNGSHGISISAERDGQADCMFIVIAFQKSGDGRRNTSLTSDVKSVVFSDCSATLMKVIVESLLYILLNLFFGMSGTRQKDAGGSGLCPFDAFGMIMGDTGIFAGCP